MGPPGLSSKTRRDQVITEDRLFTLAGVIAIGWLLYLLSPILTPFVAAALLAYIGDPLVDRLEKFKFPRTIAVLTVFVLTFVMLGLLVLLIVPLASAQVGALAEAIPGYVSWIEERVLPSLAKQLGQGPGGDEVGLAAFLSQYGSTAGELGTKMLSSLTRSGGAILSGLVSLFLIPVVTFYMLRDWDHMMDYFRTLIPESSRETTLTLAREADESLGGFLRGQLMVMLSLSAIYTTGLYLIGLKFALAIGVVAGLVSFVPYLGFIVGIGLAGLSAASEPNAAIMLLFVFLVFAVGQAIEGMFLTPKLVGDRIGLHPVVVIFSVLAGGQLFGFFGILLALPAAAVVSVLLRFAYHRLVGTKTDKNDPADVTG